MANWRDLFKPWILERGQAYFEYGQVTELEDDGDLVRAEVSGSQDYHVEIRRSGKRVERMSCDCPYADKEENCKHMAAVLCALEDQSAQQRTGCRLEWQVALEKLTEEQMRTLLRSMAEENGSLQDRIVRLVAGPGTEPSQWQDDLEQIILDHSDYRGWLGYDRAYNCMMDIVEYLEESLMPLLIEGKLLDAAKLVMTVYGTAFSQDMDDSDGGLANVSAASRESLGKILYLSEPQQEWKIFYMLHEFLEGSDWDYGSDDLEELILSLNWSEELQQKNLQYLDDNLDSWRMERRAELMERMGASKAEIIAWWEQFRKNDSAYRPLLRLYEEHDLPKAIELVREHQKSEKNTPWQMVDYTKTLLGLLEKAGEQAEYEKELRHLVLERKCQEREYVSRLKKITPSDQWSAVFASLMADAKRPSDRMALYHFEGMLDELFAELCRHPSFSSFQCYAAELREWDPPQTRTYYVEILKQEMDAANQRKQYRHIIRYLSDLSTYPGGQKAAKELAEYWHVYHRNRPAMKDELRQAGYPQK